MQAPAPNTRPLRAPLRGTGMTRPNAAAALESAAKARANMQTAQQRGMAAGGQKPMAPQAPAQKPGAAPAQAPQRQQAAPAPRPTPQAYSNPEWNPRAQAASQLSGLSMGVPKPVPVQTPQGYQLPAGKAMGLTMSSVPGTASYTGGAADIAKKAAMPLWGLPGKMQGASLPWEVSPSEEDWDPLSGEFMPPGEQVSDPLNDPSMWSDMTDEFEEDYGTPQEQKAKQDAALAQQQAFMEEWGMTPEEFAAVMGEGGPDLAGLMPEGWEDTAALAGLDESDWANEANPGPGFAWNPDTGKWEKQALPPGVSRDDPRWTFNEESGQWQLHDYEKEGPLVDGEYMGEWTKGLIESDVEDYMNPMLEKQKKEAWDQAQQANYELAQALGARGIGASGLAGMGMGDIYAATQANVQSLEFDEYTAAAERRLKELQLALSGRQGDLSAETQKELADKAAELEKFLAESQYAREDRDDIWTDIDNYAAAFEKDAPKGWSPSSLSAYRKWASTPGNDFYKAEITVSGDSVIFDEKASNQNMKDAGYQGGTTPANPMQVGFDESWLDTPESAYDAYVEGAKSVGAPRMSYAQFAAWVWENYKVQLPAGGTGPSGGSGYQSKDGDADYGDGDGAPAGMTQEEFNAWFEDEYGIEGTEE